MVQPLGYHPEMSSGLSEDNKQKKDQIKDPATAAKKQARVWISQAVNHCFEYTQVLGVYKEAILAKCFPSKSNRKSGDHHISKCLGFLSHLDPKDEIISLEKIIYHIQLKIN